MALPAELHTKLSSPQVAAPVVTAIWSFTNSTTADATFYGPKITRKMKLIRASYAQTADATAVTSYTCQLKNGSTVLTSALDIKALGATTSGHSDFTMTTTEKDKILADGDQITAVFDETGGTVTAPGAVTVMLEFQLLA